MKSNISEGGGRGMQKEKLEMLTAIINFATITVAFFHGISQNYNVLFYVSLIFALIAGSLSFFYWIKRYPIWKRYKFIQYLFFEVQENKFNIAPKVLLFFDLKKVKNCFEVDKLVVSYTLTEEKGEINSDVTYNLKDVSNVTTNDFYYYTGNNSGEIQNQKLIIKCNDNPETRPLLPDNQINSENGVSLYHWNIPERLKKNGNKVEEMELRMEQKNGFDFNNKEAINLFPWNIAKKIKKIELKITYPASLGEISMQIFELGKIKGEKFPYHYSFDSKPYEESKDATTKSYIFNIDDVHEENLYYVLLQKIDQ